MRTLTGNDLQFVLGHLPKDVFVMIKTQRLILAGGFIRATIAGEKPSDIDILGDTKEHLEGCAKQLADDRDCPFHRTENAITVLTQGRIPVQFVTRWVYTQPIDVVQSFDFTIAMAAIWYDGKWCSMVHDTYYEDLAARRLVYTCPARNEDAGGSIMRVRKFLARGYNIQAQSLAKVIARLCMGVHEIGRHSESELSRLLEALLREVDPSRIVDGVEIVDEHNVINLLSTLNEVPPKGGVVCQ